MLNHDDEAEGSAIEETAGVQISHNFIFLPYDEQQRVIVVRASYMIIVGIFLVIVLHNILL